MTYHKSPDNSIHFLDDDTFEHLLPKGCIQITEGEAKDIRQSQIILPTYQQLRAAEYPPMTDYLDGIVKNDQVQIQTYIDACLAVKKKYPKP